MKGISGVALAVVLGTMLPVVALPPGLSKVPEQSPLSRIWETGAYSADSKISVHEGRQAMMTLTMESGAHLCEVLGDPDTAKLCSDTASTLRNPADASHPPPFSPLPVSAILPMSPTTS